jgi:cell division protein FtsI/penicillin-binding protein 2
MARPNSFIGRHDRLGATHISKIYSTNLTILSIIFGLVGLAVVARLFWLQIVRHNYYLAIASDQHEFNSQLAPIRGQIFVHNNSSVTGSDLYPIATNRRFFTLYAVPRDLQVDTIAELRQQQAEKKAASGVKSLPIVVDQRVLAEVLFETFDQPLIVAEIDKKESDRLKQELDKQMEQLAVTSTEQIAAAKEDILNRQQALLGDSIYQEMAKIRRETAIKEKSEAKISEYLTILDKGDDPYEIIAKKLTAEQISKIYFKILSRYSDNATIKPADLAINGEQIMWQPVGQDQPVVVRINGLGQQGRDYRYYPEKNIGANILGFVALEDDDDLIGQGRYGLEGSFDDILMGRAGSVKGERSANQVIILQGRDYQQQVNGSDLILTIDRSIQNMACTKLSAAVIKNQADSGSVVVIEPQTGAILAMCSAPDFDPNNFQLVKDLRQFNNQPTFEAYEPGSIFKAITMAIGVDQGKVTPQTTYNDLGSVKVGSDIINNSDLKGRGVVNMVRVLQDSLNTGMVYVLRQLGVDSFRAGVKKFGFGQPTGIELESESAGSLSNLYQKFGEEINTATASFGQGINVTTLQMAMAFGALANEGKLMRPYLLEEIVKPDGTRVKTEPQLIRQVVSPQAARTVGGMLVNVVEDGHGKKAGVDGYYVAGKTGTAQVPRQDGRGYLTNVNIGSFAGYAPVEKPAFVMVVRIDHPRGVVWAESSAAPLFGEIANFILKYKQIPAERPAK